MKEFNKGQISGFLTTFGGCMVGKGIGNNTALIFSGVLLFVAGMAIIALKSEEKHDA